VTEETDSPPGFRYNGLAIYALIMSLLSLLWLLFGLEWAVFSILGILAGLRAKKEIESAAQPMEGRGLAIGAIVAGGVGLTSALFILLVLLTAPPA
jgi:hypothetical protein